MTTWDVWADSATVDPTGTGEFRVTLHVEAKKLRKDSTGKPAEIPMNDLVDIAVFAPGKGGTLGEPLYMRWHRIRSGRQTISVIVAKEPVRAGIDPFRKLIDRYGRNNIVDVKPANSGGASATAR